MLINAGKVDLGRDRPAKQLRVGRCHVQSGHPILEVRPEGDARLAAGLLRLAKGSRHWRPTARRPRTDLRSLVR